MLINNVKFDKIPISEKYKHSCLRFRFGNCDERLKALNSVYRENLWFVPLGRSVVLCDQFFLPVFYPFGRIVYNL